MLGAGRKAAQHVERLARQFGTSDLMNSIDELIRRSEQVMRNRIRECPNGVYYSDGYIESDGYTGEPLAARLKLTIEETAHCGFHGNIAAGERAHECRRIYSFQRSLHYR